MHLKLNVLVGIFRNGKPSSCDKSKKCCADPEDFGLGSGTDPIFKKVQIRILLINISCCFGQLFAGIFCFVCWNKYNLYKFFQETTN
jgi:hypothetical protein